MISLETLSLIELKSTLRKLKLYKDMEKKLWKRGISLFHNTLSSTAELSVEYFPSLGEDSVYQSALSVYQKIFSLSPEKAEIRFIPKIALAGGIKVYKDDISVDMSFSKIERLLKK